MKRKIICRTCNKVFRAWISHRETFCSTKCYGKWRSIYYKGKNNVWWKGGPSLYKDRKNKLRKKIRHELGITKRYIEECVSTLNPEERKQERKLYAQKYRESHREELRLLNRKYKYSRKKAGKLTKKRIQLVYEDNIKKYGTLTCYLCEKPIPFGKDHLEHKTPISRGGTNKYNNLAVACQRCNNRKHAKTVEEFKIFMEATWDKPKQIKKNS